MRDPPVAALADRYWGRWEAAIRRRDPIALGALERLGAEVSSGVISKHHDWEKTVDGRGHGPGRPVNRRLSPRETELLQLLADGHTDLTAASELGIGRATVKQYVRNVLRKLGARNRTHAVVIAIGRGEIQ